METDDFQSFWVKEQGLLSGSFSVGWAKAGISIVMDPDDWGICAWLGPLTQVSFKPLRVLA